MNVKPKPVVKEGYTTAMCSKCSGSGIYASMIVNGMPYSPTGTVCWKCNGRGWIIKAKRNKRAKIDWSQARIAFTIDGILHYKNPDNSPCSTCGEIHPI